MARVCGGLVGVAAALGCVVSLAGPGCDKEPRHDEPQRVLVRDGGTRSPAPTPAPDAELAEPDAAVPAPLARVRLPRLSACTSGVWCAPAAQTVEFASPRAGEFQGCPTALRMSKAGQRFSFDVMRGHTTAEQDAGKQLCCYTWRGPCHPVGTLDDPFAGL